MKKKLSLLLLLLNAIIGYGQTATLRLDATTKYQRITGFGGFVCSPQFTYNHMSADEIKKVWGKGSTVGCNIMRLYIPIGRNAWSLSLQTAKTAKQMGLIVFASPWGQPAEWKTNGTSNAKNSDGTEGRLKKENWADYAQYLEDYVQYMRKNGVELDAISIQNEPDWPASYAGCLWSASEMAQFVKTYGRQISCKIMAPETLAVNDSYANALNKSDVLPCFDIYGGHQYGGIQSAYKQLAQKGKELWMTEYLINWNENQPSSRNFDFSKDFFDFFRAINTCMVGNFNAWIHYAAKRYYGMLGDGQNGTANGTVTKRGYVMAHFARYVTGMTRIAATFGGPLEGSAYLSTTGDTVVTVVANSSADAVQLTVDLPFYTTSGRLVTTTKSRNFISSAQSPDETCRPQVQIPAQSVATVLFVRSHDRQHSDMKGVATRFDRLDDMPTTKTTFGSTYKLSGKSKTFDSANPLISSRKTTTAGYIALGDRFTQLVMHVKKVTSTNSMTAGRPTLYYVNDKGTVSSHEYERLDLSQGQDFDIVLDLSPTTLPDGCIGLLSFTCDNSQSHLSISFGDVYLSRGISTYHGQLSGTYIADDSNVLDYSTDAGCTSVDMTAVTGLPSTLSWLEGSNRVVYVAADSPLTGTNVVKDGVCATLAVDERRGLFRPLTPFTATTATYTCSVNGSHIVQLPFEATVPQGAVVYTLTSDLQPAPIEATVPANQPLLVVAQGDVTFAGSGSVKYASCPFTDDVLPIDTSTAIDGIMAGETLPDTMTADHALYNLAGQRVDSNYHGLIIRGGKKILIK